MVSVPGIQDGLASSRGYGLRKVEWAGGVVRLTQANLVEGLQVHRPARLAVLFGNHDHAGAPGGWRTNGDGLNYAHGNIPVEVGLDLFFPVVRYWGWCVDGLWRGSWINVDVHGRAGHGWERPGGGVEG